MKIAAEFREFAMRGNVVDLAIGVIIGGAFALIVSSLVNDVLMPPLGWLAGGLDFKDKKFVIQHQGETHPITKRVLPADVIITYGKFINNVINFLIVAVAIFTVIKGINLLRRKQAAKPDPDPPPPTNEEKLLMEIRDLLAKQSIGRQQ
jgi:large conductance mechanosensitive channel